MCVTDAEEEEGLYADDKMMSAVARSSTRDWSCAPWRAPLILNIPRADSPAKPPAYHKKGGERAGKIIKKWIFNDRVTFYLQQKSVSPGKKTMTALKTIHINTQKKGEATHRKEQKC